MFFPCFSWLFERLVLSSKISLKRNRFSNVFSNFDEKPTVYIQLQCLIILLQLNFFQNSVIDSSCKFPNQQILSGGKLFSIIFFSFRIGILKGRIHQKTLLVSASFRIQISISSQLPAWILQPRIKLTACFSRKIMQKRHQFFSVRWNLEMTKIAKTGIKILSCRYSISCFNMKKVSTSFIRASIRKFQLWRSFLLKIRQFCSLCGNRHNPKTPKFFHMKVDSRWSISPSCVINAWFLPLAPTATSFFWKVSWMETRFCSVYGKSDSPKKPRTICDNEISGYSILSFSMSIGLNPSIKVSFCSLYL